MTLEHLGQQSEILRHSMVQEYNELCQKLVTLQRQRDEIEAKLKQALDDLNISRGKCIAIGMMQDKINDSIEGK